MGAEDMKEFLNKYGEDMKDLKIESLRQQLAAMTAERDKAKAMPMRYRRMEFNAQLQNEIESLRQQLILKEHQYDVMKVSAEVLAEQCEKMRQQLADSQKREVTLRKLIGEIYCSDDSSAEVTRKIEGVLNALGNSYSKESTQGFEDWHSSHAKYMEPADIIHWCRDAYNAGVTSKCDVQLDAAIDAATEPK